MDDIFFAVRSGNVDDYLSAIKNVNINGKNEDGANLLHMAIAYNQTEIALDLLSGGIELDDRNGEGMSCLISAVVSKRNEIAKVLLQRGADVRVRDFYGNDALWYAVGNPQLDYDLIRLLLEKGSDRNQRNQAGLCSTDIAKRIGDSKLIDLLTAIHAG